MIKKLSVIIIITALFLCGCQVTDYTEPEDRLIVTAFAIDNENGELVVTLETVDVVKNTNDDEYHPTFYKGIGKTLPNALIEASLSSGGKLLFSQCPVILLGDSLNSEQISEIVKHCVEDYEISLSVQLLSCNNAAELLSETSGESKLAGYEILQLINFGDEIFGITKNEGIIDVFNQDTDYFILPRIDIAEKKAKISGTVLYNKFTKAEQFDVLESQLIFAAVNKLKNSSLNINDDFLKLKKSKTIYENSVLNIKLISEERAKSDFSAQKSYLEKVLVNIFEKNQAKEYITVKNSAEEIAGFNLSIIEEI